MKPSLAVAAVLTILATSGCSQANGPTDPASALFVRQSSPNALASHASIAAHAFRIREATISGAPTGIVFLNGGGSYDPASGVQKLGGHFRCLQDVAQGPLSGLKAGEGVRWRGIQIIASTGFKCSGAASEALKAAVTDDDTVVLLADFFRQGDGDQPSFSARIFFSAGDEAPDLPGVQNVWIQGVGCADAAIEFGGDR
jgi:hypothetical protein